MDRSVRRLDRAIGGACYGFQPHPLRGSLSCQSEKGRAPFLPKPLGSAGEWHSNRQAAPPPAYPVCALARLGCLYSHDSLDKQLLPRPQCGGVLLPDLDAAPRCSLCGRSAPPSPVIRFRPRRRPTRPERVVVGLAPPPTVQDRRHAGHLAPHRADGRRGVEFRQKAKPLRRRGLPTIPRTGTCLVPNGQPCRAA